MIQVLNGVAPKRGRLATGSYTRHGLVPIGGDPFGFKGAMVYPAQGDDFNVVSKGAGHPMQLHHNVATQVEVPAATIVTTTSLARPLGRSQGHNVPLVQPHEHGAFFGKKKLTVERHTGGPSKTSDTAFHPKKNATEKNRPARKTAIAGERHTAASFPSHVRLLADAQFNPHGGASRWATVKRGAAG